MLVSRYYKLNGLKQQKSIHRFICGGCKSKVKVLVGKHSSRARQLWEVPQPLLLLALSSSTCILPVSVLKFPSFYKDTCHWLRAYPV